MAECCIDGRRNFFDTRDGSQSNQCNQQGIFDQILAVFIVEKKLETNVETEKELVHLILRELEFGT